MRPLKTLFFTLAVFVLLAGTMMVTPADGVKMGGFTFHMPTFGEMFLPSEEEYADVSEILEHQFDIDSLATLNLEELAVSDSISEVERASYDSLVQAIHKIEITAEGKQNLARFFKKLDAGNLTRVMHYGDSQLEGDRITGFLRDKLQSRFGGTGPGLVPAVQPYDYVFTTIHQNSPNWKRFPIYGSVDTLVRHNRYGVMGAFARYAPLTADSVPFIETEKYEAEFSIEKTNISFHKTRVYDRFRMFYGNTKRPVDYEILVKDNVVHSGTLKENVKYDVVGFDLPDSTDAVKIRLSGYDGPDIYGVELASKNGVIVDNIALRGCSGTIFTKNDYTHSTRMYNDLNPGLFILQFGGNVMPYIKDQKAIDSYGRYFKGQILRLKQSCPDAAFIVIGPSDMSTKVKDRYVTYEYLPSVVEALKNAALETGCGYWDMYQAMGGHNSMPGWVNAIPELARPDYVHFSAKGARLISNMFYNAFILEYSNYLKDKE